MATTQKRATGDRAPARGASSAEGEPVRARRTGRRRGLAPTVEAEISRSEGRGQPRPAEIACRAFELYLRRGAQPGRALDDWLQAEHELRTESGDEDVA